MIRELKKEDLPIVSELIKKVLEEVESEYYPSEIINMWKEELSDLSKLEKDMIKSDYLIYEENNEILGIGALEEAHIKRVYVLPDHQGRGIGTRIVKNLEQLAKEKGLSFCELNSTVNAIDFYKNLYYEIIGEKTIERRGVTVTFTSMKKYI